MKNMKRVATVLCLALVMMLMSATACFGADGVLEIDEQYPENGATGMAVENASIKIWFDQDVMPKNDKVRKANEKAIKLVDEDGKKVPIRVVYSPDEEGVMMVLSDTDAKVKGDTEYTLTITDDFQATSGDKLKGGDEVTFKTLNQQRSMTVNMVLMVVMMVGMVFFSMKSTQHQQQKEKQEKGKHDTVNPYKEAKRTGKSVEEIVAKDKKVKEKEAAAAAKREAERAKKLEEERKAALDLYKVAGPKPISAAGGKYKKPVKKEAPKTSNKGTTKPKNQTGKQKNKKK